MTEKNIEAPDRPASLTPFEQFKARASRESYDIEQGHLGGYFMDAITQAAWDGFKWHMDVMDDASTNPTKERIDRMEGGAAVPVTGERAAFLTWAAQDEIPVDHNVGKAAWRAWQFRAAMPAGVPVADTSLQKRSNSEYTMGDWNRDLENPHGNR